MRGISVCIHSFSAALLLAAAFWPAGAHAQILVHFDLPAQPLARSLKAIGAATNTDVGFNASQVAGLLAPPLKAELTVDGALMRVLAGTGLRPQHLDDHTIVIAAIDASASNSVEIKLLRARASASVAEPADSLYATNVVDNSSDADAAQVDEPTQVGSESNRKGRARGREELEELVVTGTHIQGSLPVGASLRVLDHDEIERSGYSTTQELIQSLPENFRGGAAGASADANLSAGTNAGFNGAYGSGINLRGLGNTATLVLVNGHRIASSGNGYFADISTTPISAIDHIDLLTDGTSAIYGSDAIAGVVNIILKQESDGVDLGARYGSASGFSSESGNIQAGDKWSGGGATFGVDVSHQGMLDVEDRSFTSTVPRPTSIFPSYDQTALSGGVHHRIGDRLEFHGDAEYAEKTVTSYHSTYGDLVGSDAKVNRWSGSIGASFRPRDSWVLRYNVSAAQGVEKLFVNDSTVPAYSNVVKQTDGLVDYELAASGDLFLLPAGPVKLAAGLSYRGERFVESNVSESGASTSDIVSRAVTAEYGEIRVPLVSERNSVIALRKLTFSAALRHDRYTDFGGTTNPKFGLSWFPTDTLEIRGSYSRSFRAPAAGRELIASKNGTQAVAIFSFVGPNNTANVPVAYLIGAQPNLKPETARNWTFGLDFRPELIPNLRLSVNYYDISYANQLNTPPSTLNALNTPALASTITQFPNSATLQNAVNLLVAGGAFYTDQTGGEFGPNPLANAVYIVDGRIQNLSKTATSGIDLEARYALTLNSDRFDVGFNATYIDKFAVQVTPDGSPIGEVNIVGYPARLRIRSLGELVARAVRRFGRRQLTSTAIRTRRRRRLGRWTHTLLWT